MILPSSILQQPIHKLKNFSCRLVGTKQSHKQYRKGSKIRKSQYFLQVSIPFKETQYRLYRVFDIDIGPTVLISRDLGTSCKDSRDTALRAPLTCAVVGLYPQFLIKLTLYGKQGKLLGTCHRPTPSADTQEDEPRVPDEDEKVFYIETR